MSTMPHTAVSQRDSLSSRVSSTPEADQRLVEIQDGRRCQRVERSAQIGHRRRENGGDDESGDAVRQAPDDEGGENLVIGRHRRQRMDRIVGVQHQADGQEQRELSKHHEARKD